MTETPTQPGPASAAAGDRKADLPPPDDGGRRLFERARAGDRSAYGDVVRLYQDRLYHSVRHLVSNEDDARDLTQEALARGLDKIGDFRGDAGPYTWLFRIAMNLAVTHLRTAGRRRTVSLDAATNGRAAGTRGGGGGDGSSVGSRLADARSADPSDAVEKRESADRLSDALGRVDEVSRAILVMRDLEGFDYQQMADLLGLPLGTLKSRLFRARLALRDRLAEAT